MNETYYFVDTEATGLDFKNDRVIQIAFIKLENNRFEAFNDLCYTDVEISKGASEVHNITPSMLEDKYWPDETDSFLELSKGNNASNYFISHNGSLDIAMLAHEGLDLQMKYIDTDRCARHLLSDAKSYKLEELVNQYNLGSFVNSIASELSIKHIQAHDALSDALWHYALYSFLLEKVGNNPLKLLEFSNTPVLLEKIPFGQYKSKLFKDVIEKDPMTLGAMYVNLQSDWEDLLFTLQYWLQSKQHLFKQLQAKRKQNSLSIV